MCWSEKLVFRFVGTILICTLNAVNFSLYGWTTCNCFFVKEYHLQCQVLQCTITEVRRCTKLSAFTSIHLSPSLRFLSRITCHLSFLTSFPLLLCSSLIYLFSMHQSDLCFLSVALRCSFPPQQDFSAYLAFSGIVLHNAQLYETSQLENRRNQVGVSICLQKCVFL